MREDEEGKKEEGEERSDGEVVDEDEDKENKESDSEDEGEVTGDQEDPARKVEKKEETSPEKSKDLCHVQINKNIVTTCLRYFPTCYCSKSSSFIN